MIHDKIFDLAQDRACLMALTPHHGGAWWSARRDGMADTTPRNFSENPMAWCDLGAVSAVGMDDWEFGGEMYLNSLITGKYLIYRSVSPRIGLYVNSATSIQMINYTAVDPTGVNSSNIRVYTNPPLNTWIKWRMQRINGWLRWFIDDVEVMASDKTGKYVTMDSAAALTSNGDSLMRNLYFKNLTSNKTTWRYPNPAERLGLIRKNTATTVNGVFELPPTNDYRTWSVATPLSLIDQAGVWTFLCRVRQDDYPTATATSSSYFGQGQAYYGIECCVGHVFPNDGSGMMFNVGMKRADGTLTYRFIRDTATERYRWYTTALTVDFGRREIAAYVDGRLIELYNMPDNVVSFGMNRDPAQFPFALGNPLTAYPCSVKIGWAFVLNRAMSADEIAAFS